MFMSSRFSTFSHVGDQLVTKSIGVGARDFLGTVTSSDTCPKETRRILSPRPRLLIMSLPITLVTKSGT